MFGKTKMTRHTLNGVLTGEQIKAARFLVRVERVSRKSVKLAAEFVDDRGRTIATIDCGELTEGSTLTLANVDEALKLKLIAD
jgi:hypothetical protein